MKTTAALMLGPGQDWTISEIDLAGPGPGEVLVEFTHAGLCFSDEHLRHGNLGALPAVGGHEGAGIVLELGDGVQGLEVGDHVAASFIPTCGQCEWCVTGHSNLCERAANDPSKLDMSQVKFTLDGEPIPANCGLGTFARHSVVSANAVIKVNQAVPLEAVAVASCGVLTGWGAAVHAAEIGVGDTVIVIGAGGVGVNAVQGSRFAGAKEVILVDTNPAKLEFARPFGATAEFQSTDEAAQYARQANPRAQGADKVIVCTGNTVEPIISAAYDCLGKRGTLVLAGMSQDIFDKNIHLPGTQIIFNEQTIKGTIFGSCNPRHDIPLVMDLYARGLIKLDELVTRQYSLEEINLGFDDLTAGKNLRGVVKHA